MSDAQQHPTPTEATELERLAALDQKPFLPRTLGYLRHIGPGYMQSAMTLGGGTAFASIFAGAAFGYQLLWVAPLAMLLGIIVLSAVAYQTLSTGQRPFAAMREHAGPFFAHGWAIGAILSSIIWQFAQYALASSMLVAVLGSVGVEVSSGAMGAVTLGWCVAVALLYSARPRLVRLYENIIKGVVWLIIACFGLVVIQTGIPNPSEFFAGFVPSIPEVNKGVEGTTLIVSGLAAAVGANMIFVYPYTLRKRGWGRAHRRLARIDLGFGMFLPYAIAATLMVVASASVFHYGNPDLFQGKGISPVETAQVLAAPDRLGPTLGMWVFGLGIVAMAISSITMQMLSSGFALCEMNGWEPKGLRYRIGLLLPAIGVLGSIFWQDMRMWVAVPTNIICGFLLPISYIAFALMQRKRSYLKDDLPEGPLAKLWIAGMALATTVLVAFLAFTVWDKGPSFLEQFSK